LDDATGQPCHGSFPKNELNSRVGLIGWAIETMSQLSFEPAVPGARVPMQLRGGKQYIDAPALIQQMCQLTNEQHAVNKWESLERACGEEWKGETIIGRLQDGFLFYGITLPCALKLLEKLGKQVKLTDEQRASVVQVIRGRFSGSQRVMGGDPVVIPVAAGVSQPKVEKVRMNPVVVPGESSSDNKPNEPRVINKEDQVGALKVDGVEGGKVRMVVKDGVRFLSARDIIKHQCQKNSKQVLQAWDKIDEEVKKDLEQFTGKFTFAGSGEVSQPVLEARGALRLVMCLETACAERNRAGLLELVAQVWAGDTEEFVKAACEVRDRCRRGWERLDRLLVPESDTKESEEAGAKRARLA